MTMIMAREYLFMYVCMYTRLMKRKLARVILTFDQNMNFYQKELMLRENTMLK